MTERFRYLIERAGCPAGFREFDDPAATREHRRALGGQAEWCWAIPWVHRALASPHTRERMPAAPRPDIPHPAACGYWSALLHLLVFSLGWGRPDRGLRWWYDAGRPTDDPRLALLSQVWDADGQLDWFSAWLWDRPLFHPGPLMDLTGYQPTADLVPVDRTWIEHQRASAGASGVSAPISGDADQLHLTYHWTGPVDHADGDVHLYRANPEQRSTVLVCDSMTGWYRALAEQGGALPHLGERDWRVDVVVRPTGWLGTYRRSWETKLWFAGNHRYHLVGT